jgi:CRP/FNR family cyclic AMP-dependent transcriptional regulator
MDELTPQAEALRRVPFFEDLTDEDLERMVRIGEIRRFEPGENLVSRGEVGGGLFVIVSGTARVQTGGKEHTLEPGAFIGEMALLERRPRSATVTASTQVEALTIEAMHFKPFLIKNPSVAVAILEGVVGRLREVQERLDTSEGASA